MDPKWNGQCTADDCSINGPPDGNSDPTFTDDVRFSSMVKDIPDHSVALAGLTRAIAVGTGTFHTCARLGDGTIQC